jgi:hypothetical protein
MRLLLSGFLVFGVFFFLFLIIYLFPEFHFCNPPMKKHHLRKRALVLQSSQSSEWIDMKLDNFVPEFPVHD